jgi:dolichol kinase
MDYERRLVHFSGTVVPVAYLVGVLEWGQVRLLLVVAAVAAVALEVVRLYVGLDWAVFDRLTRHYEQENPAGYALAIVGAALVGVAFPPEIAVPSLLVLTISDPIAGVLGDVDNVDNRKAGWVMATTFLVCLAITAPLLPLRAAVPVSAVVVVADAVKPRVFGFVIDDNFSIPVGAGVTGWAVVTYVPPIL